MSTGAQLETWMAPQACQSHKAKHWVDLWVERDKIIWLRSLARVLPILKLPITEESGLLCFQALIDSKLCSPLHHPRDGEVVISSLLHFQRGGENSIKMTCTTNRLLLLETGFALQLYHWGNTFTLQRAWEVRTED
jgi:hypothetical protein